MDDFLKRLILGIIGAVSMVILLLNFIVVSEYAVELHITKIERINDVQCIERLKEYLSDGKLTGWESIRLGRLETLTRTKQISEEFTTNAK